MEAKVVVNSEPLDHWTLI